ncbi:MAG: M23 family metallopeptidase [Bifidobacterium bifidum]
MGQPAVIADFDPPDRPWLSGHRGVDLQASDGDELYAPADGIISFAGSVGGKSVVSVNHGDLVSTFEPAHTEGVAGTAVRRGDVIGEVGGHPTIATADASIGGQEGSTAKRGDGDDIS